MATFKLPLKRQSGYDPAGDVEVKLHNDLERPVKFAWVDYGGNADVRGECASGESWSQQTNSEHPWLISTAQDEAELACCCFTGATDIELSRLLVELLPDRTQKPGFLNGGGDFAAGVTQDHAERLVAANPGKVMGYTYMNANPNNCWVKVCGVGYTDSPDWTTVVFDSPGGSAKDQRKKRHNIFQMNEQAPVCDCSWEECAGDNVTCEAMGKTYVPHKVEGLHFFVEQGCFQKFPSLHDQIEGDVAEIIRLLPTEAMDVLNKGTAVWINDVLHYPDCVQPQSGAWCHWGPWFPKSHGDLPQKGNCVEICQCRHYVEWASGQPAMLLHELSHAYHVICRDKIDGIIQAAYEAAMESGIYETEERDGRASSSKPYCATNAAEYFAECSEAFWSSRRFHNDYFPYVHAELKGFDPVGYKMCEEAWGVSGSEMPSRAEVPEKWMNHFAKLSNETIMQAFKAVDLDKSGTLDDNEFGAALASAIGDSNMSMEEVQALKAFADVDQDGVVNYAEFAAWLTATIGAYVKH